jgi:hypothetical protein
VGDEEMPRQRIVTQLLPPHRRQGIEALALIGGAGRQPNAHGRWEA